MLNGDAGAFEWEAGLRYETTDLSIVDRTALTTTDNDYSELLPSAHLRWNLTDEDRISLSVARTIRRASFTFLSPAVLEAELGDNDFFVVLLDSTYAGTPANPMDKNLAFYQAPGSMNKVPVGVNLAYGNTGLFTQCVNGETGCSGETGSISTCMGTRPRRVNRAWSASTSGLPVVSSFSP